jgi:hypothetical protein
VVKVDSDEHIIQIVSPKVREIYGDTAELGHYKLAIAIYKLAMEAWQTLPLQTGEKVIAAARVCPQFEQFEEWWESKEDELDGLDEAEKAFKAVLYFTGAAAPPQRAAPSQCADCDEAAKHAYSDATTPGFFSAKCAKHREPAVPPVPVEPHEHLIIGTERAGHCVYCDARFTGKDVQYIKREL